MEYGLNGITTENLKPVAHSIFTLMKPLIDINNKRFNNGCNGGRPPKTETKQKPNDNQTETKPKPNVDVDVNDNVDEDKETSTKVDEKKNTDENYLKFIEWLNKECPFCADIKHFPTQIDEAAFLRLKSKYSSLQIMDALKQLENRRDLRKRYVDLNLTVQNWIKTNAKKT